MNWFTFTLLSVFGHGTAFFLYKRTLTKYKLGETPVIFAALLVTSLIFLPVFWASYNSNPVVFTSQEGLRYFLIATLGGIIATYFLIHAISLGEISFVGPLENLRPFFAVLFSYLILREQPSIFLIVGVIFIFAGATFLHLRASIKGTVESILNSKVSLYVTLSALLFGLVAVLDRLALQYTQAAKYVFLALSMQTVAFFLISLRQLAKLDFGVYLTRSF